MPAGRITLLEYLRQQSAQHQSLHPDLGKLVLEIAKAVQDGRVDIGIVSGQVDTLGLQSLHFSTDRLVLATSRQHRFAKRKRIAFAEILDEDICGRDQPVALI